MKIRRRGFTLIELLAVMLLVAVLMLLLMPAVSAVQRAVKAGESRRRVEMLSMIVEQYKMKFGDYPLSSFPTSGDYYSNNRVNGYPDFVGPNNRVSTLAINEPWGNQFEGGSFLVYFLLGPEQGGWNPSQHGTSVRWEPPGEAAKMLCPKAFGVGRNKDPQKYAFYFEDGFGYQGGSRSGVIGYSVANPRRKAPGRIPGWPDYDMCHTFEYTECRGYMGGDGAFAHLRRLLKQCNRPFALVASGADHRFGYYTWGTLRPGVQGWQANSSKGISDDICNFPHN